MTAELDIFYYIRTPHSPLVGISTREKHQFIHHWHLRGKSHYILWFVTKQGLVCWSLTSHCHRNGYIETMPAREINPFTALNRIRSQFLGTQWRTSISEWTKLRLRPLSHRGWMSLNRECVTTLTIYPTVFSASTDSYVSEWNNKTPILTAPKRAIHLVIWIQRKWDIITRGFSVQTRK